MHISRQDIINLRDSQTNVLASLGVYAGVWTILQVLLALFKVEMPLVQIFDQFGNFSFPGILVTLLLLVSAFVPHWVLLRQANLSWRQASRLIRSLKEEPVPTEEDPDWVRRAPRPPVDADDADDADYWERRWHDLIKPLSDDDRESRD